MIQSIKNNGLRLTVLPGRGMLIRALAPETTASTTVTTGGLLNSYLEADAGTYDNSFLDKASL